jgi:hypothetical protein
VTLAVIVALLAILLTKRLADVNELGSVSAHWIAEHRVHSR